LWFAAGLMWPLTLAAGGLAIIWQQADDFDRSALRKVTDHLPGLPELGMRSRRAAIARTVLGVVLVAAGVGGLFALGRTVNVLRDGVVAAFGVMAGFALVFGPLWLRLVRQLADEHRQRVVSQERADIAAHLHDSVLQTLALIQRRADDPREVTRLARAQERDLRSWLFEGRVPGQTDASDGDATFARALAAVEREVESTHGVTVDAVTVGDCPLDDDVAALVAAGREAAMNAARWSGADTISLFAEVEPAHVSLFVRDRGVGFDEAAIGADRRGVAESIRGRVTRHGGTAFIRTAPGSGTEVALTMPRRTNGA
jgi:signal transduction histidine kinase